MKKGFTLVELAVVLVIIGVLIGGILAGKSMITTSKIQSTIRQIAQFDSATESFQARYKALPGDNTVFPSFYGTPKDGIITSLSGTGGYFTDIGPPPASPDSFGGEAGHFWYELKLATGFKEEDGKTYTDYSASDDNADEHTPVVTINPKSSWIATSLTGTAANENFYITQHFASMGSTADDYSTASGGTINVVDALAIDKKIDDGLDVYNTKVFTSGMSYYCDDGASGGTYVLTTADLCQLVIRMGISSGNLK